MRLKFIKKHKKDSIRWLNRHLNDEFFQLAKKQGYRSRSSYKLLQINEKFNFLESRKNILDLGCAPGGWLQVSKKLAPKDAKILGIDKLEMSPTPVSVRV